MTDSRTPRRGCRVPLLEAQVSTSRILFSKPMAPNTKSLTFLTSPQPFQHIYNVIIPLFGKQHIGQISNIHGHAFSSSFHTIPLHKTSSMQSKLLIYPFRTPKRPKPLESMRKKSTLTWIRGYRCEALGVAVPMHFTIQNLVRK